jgi:hypothetical protein
MTTMLIDSIGLGLGGLLGGGYSQPRGSFVNNQISGLIPLAPQGLMATPQPCDCPRCAHCKSLRVERTREFLRYWSGHAEFQRRWREIEWLSKRERDVEAWEAFVAVLDARQSDGIS